MDHARKLVLVWVVKGGENVEILKWQHLTTSASLI